MDHSQVGDCTMQEYSYVDLDGAGLPELDGALLMELLEDSPALDAPEDDRLSHVIRSLEAEIGGGPAAVGDGESTTGPSDVDGGLEDMLSDFGGYDGGPFEYWAEMPVGHEMGVGMWMGRVVRVPS